MGSNMTGFDVLEPTVYAQFVPAGGNIATALSAMDGTGGKLVLGLGTHTATDATLTGPTDVHIMGCGYGTILDISAVTQTNAVVIGTRGKLSDLKIVGDISPLSETWKQAVSMGTDSCAENVWLDQLASGFAATGGVSNVNLTCVKCTQIRADGMPDTVAPAAIHVANASKVFVRGFYIDDCDRGVEVEDGANGVYVEHGQITNTKITAVGGAASFTVDVHSHAVAVQGSAPVTNVHFDDIYVEDSGGITCYGGDATNYIYDCTFKNILVDNPYLVDDSYEAIAVNQATHCRFEHIRIINVTDTQILGVYSSKDITIDGLEVVNGAQSNFGVGSSVGVRLVNGRFTNSADSGYTLSVSGAGTDVKLDNVEIVDFQGSGGVFFADTLVRPTIRNCLIRGHGSTPGTSGIVVDGITTFWLLNNKFDVAADTNAINLDGASSGVVSGNYCATKPITIGSGSDNNVVEKNIFTTGTVADSGSGNIIRANPGYITENKATATVANGQTSVAVTHGLGFTPALTQIQVTPTLMSSAAKFWITSPTSTQFTINVDADPGAGTATFVWRASHS